MKGRLVLDYDPDDRYERARVAAIVRGDDERLRSALWTVTERLRRVARGKEDPPERTRLEGFQAQALLDWLLDKLDGVPLSLEE